jgi:hypothetical protein
VSLICVLGQFARQTSGAIRVLTYPRSATGRRLSCLFAVIVRANSSVIHRSGTVAGKRDRFSPHALAVRAMGCYRLRDSEAGRDGIAGEDMMRLLLQSIRKT